MDGDFHRHCQITVLSANGTRNQNGESWKYINDLKDDLENLQDDWIEDFKSNRICITQDLASILKLLDSSIGNVNSSITNITNNIGSLIKTININGTDKTPDSKGKVSLGSYLDLGGLSTMGGPIKFQYTTAIKRIDNRSYINVNGGTEWGDGATLTLRGNAADISSDRKGEFQLHTGNQDNGSDGIYLRGKRNGSLTWNGKEIVRSVDGVNADSNGNVTINPVHKTGTETITGNKTFNGATTLKGTDTKLSASPASNAIGHEVVDAAWVNNKIVELNLYSPPATLSSIRVYLSPSGNDSTALTAFNNMIKSSTVTNQTTLAETPFKTVSKAVQALNQVRSSKSGFTYYILALPGEYTIGLNTTDTIYKSVTLRHPDCNSFSGSKLILMGVHDKTGDTIAERGEVKFKFPSVQTYAGDNYGVQHSCITLVNASIENICFYQDGLTFDDGEVVYTNPCDCNDIQNGASVLIQANGGSNSIYNCECCARPVYDNNKWLSWVFLHIEEGVTCEVCCTSDKYYRHKVTKGGSTVIEGHRCCFYGLNSFCDVIEGKLQTNWRTFDYYFRNCYRILGMGQSSIEQDALIYHWINHAGNPLTYQAWELDNVKCMVVMNNNTKFILMNDINNTLVDGFYNPLKPGYLSTIVVRNSPPNFQILNVGSFNSEFTSGRTHNVIARADYNKFINVQSYYEVIN